MITLVAVAAAADFEHLLIVVADDMGTDKVGAYAADVSNPGETRPETPTIDLLADAGVRFTDAWAQPLCSPARATLMTGEYAFRHGFGTVEGWATNKTLDLSPVSLQQLAQDSGLETALFGKWHNGQTSDTPRAAKVAFDHQEYPILTGFGTYRGISGAEPSPSYTDWLLVGSIPDASHSTGYRTWAEDLTTNITDTTVDDAITWMGYQSDAGNRRLTMVSYNLVHNSDEDSGGKSWEDAVESCDGTPTGGYPDDYDIAAECLDAAIADLLERTPDLEDTLVLFVSDNGTPSETSEGYFADGRGKTTVYENGIRVPMIFADGAAVKDAIDSGGSFSSSAMTYRIDAGEVVVGPTGLVDVYATVVDLLDLRPGTCTPGVDCARDSMSLRDALVGGGNPRDRMLAETFRVQSLGLTGSGAVRIDDMKLRVATTPGCRDYELYDLAADRWETTDLYSDPAYAAERAELRAELDAYATEMSGTTYDWLDWEACCRSTEVWYDGEDDDCEGASDYDQDGDGYDAAGFGGADCDDLSASVSPATPEIWYDGLDQNCDGASDYDADGDGFEPTTLGGPDCDDTRADVHAGAPDDWYDGVDADCRGDDDFDADGDGHAVAPYGEDCDDTQSDMYGGAPDEWYDGRDTDCDGASDFDADADGHDALEFGGDDCDDAVAAVSPSAQEVWYDGVDADCDGASDFDADADGFDAVSYGGDDCDDAAGDVNPGAAERLYDGVDTNCDGASDFDRDADGHDASFAGGDDCDDGRADVRPGAPDARRDGVDQDCDGLDGPTTVEDTGDDEEPGDCGCATAGAGAPGAVAGALVVWALTRRRRPDARHISW